MSHVERIAGDCLRCVFDRLALGNDVLTADQVNGSMYLFGILRIFGVLRF